MTRRGALRGASCCAIERTGLYVAMVNSRRRMMTDCNCCVRVLSRWQEMLSVWLLLECMMRRDV